MKKKTIWITSAAVGAVLVLGGAGVAVAVTDPFELASEETLTGTTLEKASKAALNEVGGGTVTDAETSDDLGHAYEVEVTRDNGAEVDVLLDEKFGVVRTETDGDDDSAETGDSDDANETAGTGTTGTTGDTDGDTDPGDTADTLETTAPLTEADRAAASAAALAAMAPGSTGTVTEVERSDDLDHAYEVEVTLPTGEDIDMELDATFTVLKIEGVPAA